MNWTDVERAFNRAVFLSVSRKKLVLTFPVLILCGVLFVFCRAFFIEAGEWMSLSLVFLPIFLSSGILFALGILLVRLHHHEAKKITLDFKRLIQGSIDLIVGVSYFTILSLLTYFFLWLLLGIFFLMREIPGLGRFFSIVFSFGPFLLILGSLSLCLWNVGVLFFVAPAAALQPLEKISLAQRVWNLLNRQFLTALVLFFVALFPLGVVVGCLCLAAFLTEATFLIGEGSLSGALQWFFIMFPFCAILAPGIVFFFNFAAESYQLLHRLSSPTQAIYGKQSQDPLSSRPL